MNINLENSMNLFNPNITEYISVERDLGDCDIDNSVNKINDKYDKFLDIDKENKIENQYIGLPNKEYFMKIYNEAKPDNIYNINDFILQNVKGDGNCGYRAFALQLYGNEEFHNVIRENIYNYLSINRSNYSHLTFQVDNQELSNIEYIENIKNNGFYMGDLEISIIPFLYDAILFVFELHNDTDLILLNIYGSINNENNILLTLCFINNNHFNIIYEKEKEFDIPKKTKLHNLFPKLHNKIKTIEKKDIMYYIGLFKMYL